MPMTHTNHIYELISKYVVYGEYFIYLANIKFLQYFKHLTH
jgi:hypothetical protein